MSKLISRHEFLKRISILPVGLPAVLHTAGAFGGNPAGKCLLRGTVLDKETGQSVPAKVRVVDALGNSYHPDPYIPHRDSTKKDQEKPYFYCLGQFQILLPAGRYRIETCRGPAQRIGKAEFELRQGREHQVQIGLPQLRDMKGAGWFSGNTHTHYHLGMEEDPDERLRVVPPAEDLDLSVISYLIRENLPYASNKYALGRAPAFSKAGTLVDVGQETRNNRAEWDIGYGHVLFMNIPELIPPVSTGILSPDKLPDFPTLTMLCRRAKAMGGVTVWAHNGMGMECPVAVALGAVDAFNVNDGASQNYDRYYRLLNSGFRLPLSSGTDWWIFDHNRVYVQSSGSFTYDNWLEGLKAGRTFVTNGPLLTLSVDGKGPGELIQIDREEKRVLRVKASAVSRVPFDRLELVVGGHVRAETISSNRLEAEIEAEIPVEESTWIAARVGSDTLTEFGYPVFAHTSPVYVQRGTASWLKPEAARDWAQEIETSIGFIRKNYSFASQADEAVARGLFREAQTLYRRLGTEQG